MKVLRPFAMQQKTMKIRTKLELEIVKAFREKNIDSLKELLSPHGLYLGVNKPIFIAKMESLFNQFENHSCQYAFGIANQASTCNKVHEFIYTNVRCELDTINYIVTSNDINSFKIGRQLNKNQFRFQVILEFDEYDIVKISKPLKSLNLFEYYKVRKEN